MGNTVPPTPTPSPKILDISHPAARLYEEHFKANPGEEPGLDLYEWAADDPLADVFLCSYGAFPPAAETGVDYRALLQLSLLGVPNIIQNGAEVPIPHPWRDTIQSFNRAYMKRHYAVHNYWDFPGFYIGEADNVGDLINFWNLRAADIPLQFFDPRYSNRLDNKKADYARIIRQAPARPHGPQGLALWHRAERPNEDPREHFGEGGVTVCHVSEPMWNGGNVSVPMMYFGDAAALASVDGGRPVPTVSFSIPNKPFEVDRGGDRQHYVLSIDPGIGLFRNERVTLHTPFIPELNEFYGNKAADLWHSARSEPEGIGIIARVSKDHGRLLAINVNELISAVFGVAGIEATPSKAGLIASTLIQQMGGLDGCRPFKIAGVRTLVERHKPHQTFDRGAAMQIIAGQGADRPLSEYQWLHIEPGELGSTLKNSAVLAYLLEKGVFRAGLNFACPSCRLEFWRSLDDARSRLECEYCGHSFNAAPQLRDKAWAFRRSGLFGNDDHQEGAIPVLLTLQQLTEMHRISHGVFTTAMKLKTKGAAIPECETDFVVVTKRGLDYRTQIVIGEAKTRKAVTSSDVTNLKAVADAFPSDRFDVYVAFARLTPFSAEEVELIKGVNDRYRLRAIMLTDRELEPYFPYEHTAKEFDIQQNAVSFADMATATVGIFLEPRKREPDGGAEEPSDGPQSPRGGGGRSR